LHSASQWQAFQVFLKDLTIDHAKAGIDKARKALDRLVKKGKFEESLNMGGWLEQKGC